MSLLDKATPKKKAGVSIKPLLIPTYIVLSALFIIWVGYSYFNNAVYGTGVQRWYQQAILDVASQSLSEEACQKGLPLNLGNGETAVIVNAQCLGQPPVQQQPEPAPQAEGWD